MVFHRHGLVGISQALQDRTSCGDAFLRNAGAVPTAAVNICLISGTKNLKTHAVSGEKVIGNGEEKETHKGTAPTDGTG